MLSYDENSPPLNSLFLISPRILRLEFVCPSLYFINSVDMDTNLTLYNTTFSHVYDEAKLTLGTRITCTVLGLLVLIVHHLPHRFLRNFIRYLPSTLL